MYQRILQNWQSRSYIIRESQICLLLACLTLLLYWPVRFADFITFDDQLHIVSNFHLKSGFSWETILWAFSTEYGGNWHPVTWLSLMVDYRLFGLNPSGYHLFNVLIHMINAAVLFLVLHRMTKAFWHSAFVAALFAVHPMHVESVAWVSERKDLLCALFGFMAVGFYHRYVGTRKASDYLFVIVLFCLGLMSKPMIVTLPFVLLLFDFWPLKRVPWEEKRTIKEHLPALRLMITEKWPLFGLSLISCLITYHAQQHGQAVSSLEILPMMDRLMNALSAYMLYIGKGFWPVHLSVFYPMTKHYEAFEMLAYGIIFAAITVYAVYKACRCPYLIVGWLFYLGTLVPVIGLVKVGSHFMADRYSYIPFIGLFIMAAWGIPDLIKRLNHRPVYLTLAALAAIIFSSVSTWHQVHYWRNTVSLFTHALQGAPQNYVAHENLGFAFLDQGRLQEALVHFRQASALLPASERLYKNTGVALYRLGKYEEASYELRQALRTNPRYSDGYYHLGNVYFSQQRFAEAAVQYRETIRLQADHAEAHNNLAMILVREGRIEEAVTHCSLAVQLKPDFAEAWNNLGVALANRGDLQQALKHFEKALQLQPDYAGARRNRDAVLKRLSVAR